MCTLPYSAATDEENEQMIWVWVWVWIDDGAEGQMEAKLLVVGFTRTLPSTLLF